MGATRLLFSDETIAVFISNSSLRPLGERQSISAKRAKERTAKSKHPNRQVDYLVTYVWHKTIFIEIHISDVRRTCVNKQTKSDEKTRFVASRFSDGENALDLFGDLSAVYSLEHLMSDINSPFSGYQLARACFPFLASFLLDNLFLHWITRERVLSGAAAAESETPPPIAAALESPKGPWKAHKPVHLLCISSKEKIDKYVEINAAR